MTPAYEIYADGERITPLLNGRLLSLAVVDEAGYQSDRADIVVEDTRRNIALPKRGTLLHVLMGYEGNLTDLGLFSVDEVEMNGPPDTITIRGSGASWVRSGAYQAMQTTKTRSWDPGPLGDMVRKMASEAGLEVSISASAEAVALPHTDQTQESDLNLLLRIARDRDLLVKPTAGKLVVLTIKDGLTSKGQEIPTITLRPSECSTWRYRIQSKVAVESVVTSYRDVKANTTQDVRAGDGEPTFRCQQTYPNKDTAEAAAAAMRRNFRRHGAEATLTMPGRTDMIAEGRLICAGFRSELDEGEWRLTRVEHRLSRQGFSTTISCIAAEEVLPPPA